MFAGFVDVKHGTAEGSLFYWFVAHSGGDKDAPIVVWSNGGPVSIYMYIFAFYLKGKCRF
jgi:carboxypeptidase C (cathepsin A)